MLKIGVTGTFCSGKDTFAEYLVKKGFEHISLSDILREEVIARNMLVTRENLRNIGNVLRKELGGDVLAKRALKKLNHDRDYVITSIRNPLEAKILQDAGNFVLVTVDAPIEERFRRLISREDSRKEDKVNLVFEKFVEAERKEMESADITGQRVLDCIRMAKFVVVNDSGSENFYKKIDHVLPKLIELASS